MAQTYLGVTPPISTAESSAEDQKLTESLMQELRAQSTFESDQESRTREIVLGRISALVKKFVTTVAKAHGLSDATANAAGGKIFTFGSYRLGVHGPGSDIDTLCVVPKHVNRDEFFSVFEPMLREEPNITEVSGVPDAFVPIIKIKMMGIPLDLLMARMVQLSSIPDDLSLQNNELLRNLDERCIKSLGGSRLVDEILSLIPNHQVFRDALRCIKLWAQRRAIYSNINGFLGGVAWAMLVARICQLYPNAVAGTIVRRFFGIMWRWQWPQPVLLKQIEEGPLEVRIWNPQVYPSDRAHRMPIITPSYPSMNSTHNVSYSTQTVMIHEFKRGLDIVGQIQKGEASWADLFNKHTFFTDFRHYLQIVASADDQHSHDKWQLVLRLDAQEGSIIQVTRPFIKGFERIYHCISDDERRAATEGRFSDLKAAEGRPAGDKTTTVYTTAFFLGLEFKPKDGNSGTRQLNISFPTGEFCNLVKKWETYDETKMRVNVRHIKRSELPEFVYESPAERPRKRKSVAGGHSPDKSEKKRRVSAVPNGVKADTNGAASVRSTPGISTPA
uniref:Poly(A) polymerase n=1 Tax=Schizophyllum commune (strain H4-8 / FGSC 9210) TaxID=578458 RepID=D8Q4M8_SCHCM